jgi:hypothetical protein
VVFVVAVVVVMAAVVVLNVVVAIVVVVVVVVGKESKKEQGAEQRTKGYHCYQMETSKEGRSASDESGVMKLLAQLTSVAVASNSITKIYRVC